MPSDDFKGRTIEEIERISKAAKLNPNDLCPLTQLLYFDRNHSKDNFKLLELDEDLISQLENGTELCFKGSEDEQIVLCTPNKTYQVRQVETSNSLLLTTNLKLKQDAEGVKSRATSNVLVQGTFHHYLEPTSSHGHLEKLQRVLSKSVYKGPEHEYEVLPENLYTLERLNLTIQASNREINEAICDSDAICISGNIRQVELEYHFRVVSLMLKLIDENSWAPDEISYETTMESLKNIVPEDVLNGIFDKYAEETDKMGDNGVPLYSYNERKICKFFARVLLSQAGKFNLDEFLQAWRDSVPEGMYPVEEMLYGIAIIDRNSTPNGVFLFPESDLPEDINERFNELFEVKEKWSVPEITPYLRKLATEKFDVSSLLAKHARSFKVGDVQYYCSKHKY